MGQELHRVLKDIIAVKHREIEHLRRGGGGQVAPITARRLRDFLAERSGVIAEIKPASPATGTLRPDIDPAAIAAAYDRGGASAISVLTETEYFKGRREWVAEVRRQVTVPVLRKDFIIDEIQVNETAALGADLILIIARLLTDHDLKVIARKSRELGLSILFEVHNRVDLERVLPLNPEIIGVNCRDLSDFTMNKQLFAELIGEIPGTVIAVAESGIESVAEAREIKGLGYDCLLVGELLMRQPDPSIFLRALHES